MRSWNRAASRGGESVKNMDDDKKMVGERQTLAESASMNTGKGSDS